MGDTSLPYGGRVLPEALGFLKTIQANGTVVEKPMEEERLNMEAGGQMLFSYPTSGASKVEKSIDGPAGKIPLTIFSPEGEGPFPILLFFHGGGWCRGSSISHGGLAATYAARFQAVVISVDYRRSPEDPYPAAVEDCYAATVWAAENAGTLSGDAARLAMVGDSAGGNLAAAVCLMARNLKGPSIKAQVLVSPALNLAATDTPSYLEFADGPFCGRKGMQIFIDLYVPGIAQRSSQYASPLLAEDLSGLPPALILAGECEVLKDESEAYAKKLKAAGTSAQYTCYMGHFHVSMTFNGLMGSHCEGAFDEIGAFLLKNAF